MSNYIVSARKYRPDSFETLVGQENIARTLKNSIKRGQLAHAYLFCGPRGVGKTSTARIFAKTINCSDPGPDMEPCGKCESCLSFAEGRSYCIHELDAASNNGVDDIKALIDQVRIPPQTGKYSVYIIDEVHMLSSAAFNAFLKTLEEPPAYAIFILATTEKHKILPTILSRCQTYDFNRITVDGIVGNLKAIAAKEGIDIDDESLHIIAMKADGAMRDALTIFDQTVAFCGRTVRYVEVMKNLNVLDYEYSFSLTDAFLSGDYRTAFLKFDEILSKGFNALHFVSALSSHFRDLLVSKTSGLEALLELPESLKRRYSEQASRCSLPFIYEAMNITVQCESSYRASINQRFLIELTLMKLSTLASRLAGQPVLQSDGSPARDSRPLQTAAVPSSGVQPTVTEAPAVTVAKDVPAAVQDKPSTVSGSPSVKPEPVREEASGEPLASAAAATPGTEEQEKPKPRKARGARASSALSLSSLMDSPEDGRAPAAQETDAQARDVPEASDEEILAKWPELVAMYASKPRLSNTLSASRLSMTVQDGTRCLVFNVLNAAQKDWVESKLLHELEGKFRQICGVPGIRLRVDIAPEEERPQQVYMPSEKAKDLMSRNDEVRSLVSDFGLDVK
ncbi:MAG: DNA polymerase III subunit gamma/tau [Bacteroidetes bacterium]|uniref:DNA polymerase III subunit gamma/tau n=1 Tax=Candidatus Cryptobacteroides merdigallinarum TaxID=2840770 RepID=A0A9D9EM61_9BACT|nr:DNA polymerase III subunit gamma/tau [Candidatus Cryptobacteroides merdigallinarum]